MGGGGGGKDYTQEQHDWDMKKHDYDYARMKDKYEYAQTVDHPHHYNKTQLEVIDAIDVWGLDFSEGNVVKYITRHRRKGEGARDIEKVIHYCELILEKDYGRE